MTPAEPLLLTVSNLGVSLNGAREQVPLVHGISLALHAGERVGIAGESGSGKSLTLRALMGLLTSPFKRSGSLTFEGQTMDLEASPLGASPLLRPKAGAAMVFQEAKNSLSPYFNVREQALQLEAQRDTGSQEAEDRILALLEELGLRNPSRILEAYPHELSGGECQRVAAALALLQQPALLLADEPTTQLDALVQVSVLEAIGQACTKNGAALVLVSHDLAVLGSMVDRILVMQNGCPVDEGSTREILTGEPEGRHPYTMKLRQAYSALST